MKYDLEDIFDSLNEEETGELLSGLKPDRIGKNSALRITERTFALAGKETQGERSRHIPRRRVYLTAAVLAAVIALGIGSFAYAAEAKEYNTAKAFFEEYDISMAGLTRAEVKAVYRDISTKSFSYEKTGEVLVQSLSESRVPGWEIISTADTHDPEDVEQVWNVTDSGKRFYEMAWWKRRSEYERGYITGENGEETGSYVERYRGDELLWKTELQDVLIDKLIPAREGVIALGEVFWDDGNKYSSRVVRIDGSGEVKWHTTAGRNNEIICTALENDDGSVALFSRPTLDSFSFTKLSAEGKLIERTSTVTGEMGFGAAAHYKDGYIIQLFNRRSKLLAAFAKLDSHGNIVEEYSYQDEDSVLFLQDIIEYGGRIYISAYAIPNDGGSGDIFNHFDEIKPVMERVYSGELKGNKALTEALKERYSALLMILETEKCEPELFYSVKEGMGSELKVDQEGKLIWSVEMIDEATSEIAANAFRISGKSKLFEYRFNEEGALLESCDTGEFVGFHK